MVEEFQTTHDRRSSLFVHFTSSAMKNPVEPNEETGLRALSRIALGRVATTWIYHRAAPARAPKAPFTLLDPTDPTLALRLERDIKRFIDQLSTHHVNLAGSEHVRVTEEYTRTRLGGAEPNFVERR